VAERGFIGETAGKSKVGLFAEDATSSLESGQRAGWVGYGSRYTDPHLAPGPSRSPTPSSLPERQAIPNGSPILRHISARGGPEGRVPETLEEDAGRRRRRRQQEEGEERCRGAP